MKKDIHRVIEEASREHSIDWEDCQKATKQLERLEREAKYGRALLWAVEYRHCFIETHLGTMALSQGELDELMNDYERYGTEV